ncbi:uncharacterized protein AB675_7909 [Cyphellophora attinorum]|uniref:Uncharacterized protein n=1 Tax=Cyphellophora attinorum TaxID=1664694 RepID=A0A0N1P0V4_9EURO|nr:uncharacterized protein AB675_7909 [Phialophora attinorum]KPI41125.1 hypothetical protein AB675_7909 [Phialophora attinorum]
MSRTPDLSAITGHLASMSMCTTDTPSTKASAPKVFLDLPNEIQERIFEAAVPAHWSWGAGGIYLNYQGTSPQLEPGKLPEWIAPWVPQLRLISKAIEKVVTPDIGRHTVLHVDRLPIQPWYYEQHQQAMTQKPLLLREYCPKFLVDHLEQAFISDSTATTYLQPIVPLDVSGLPQLKYLAYSCFDPAEGLSVQLTTLAALTPEKSIDYLATLTARLLNYPQTESGHARAKAVVERHGVRVWSIALLSKHMVQLFEDPPLNYRVVCDALATKMCRIERTNIIGLLDTTVLAVEVVDKDAGNYTAFIKKPANGIASSELVLPAIAVHKTSSLLDRFEVEGFGTPGGPFGRTALSRAASRVVDTRGMDWSEWTRRMFF